MRIFLKMRRILPALTLGALLLSVACTSPRPSESSRDDSAHHCPEPENPYDEGSGHYAGYEWAEKNNPARCGGSSESFIEGCEEYQRQESEYADCEAQKRK